ncbi:tRNA (N6-threonylcarbamoyladenosine(37)-N6)-methyltransferase TrmO [Vibrio quintilis]|uniref:Putative tRNA (Adenine(37)-N6)-methyltransferase n=1 Tax=Vibrio quintilis TaxID=1117707 RepID=A0A1M7YQA1_9VIBR|nr:tRNA (N6-threonylcarbamoyladenosine(37)-N6)-methyltransferase TrmO [Vibrio quintilis]SHO54696.1 putative tRNA (adenine(37)-N6)-methyltransferase [Vibrio quintilis]
MHDSPEIIGRIHSPYKEKFAVPRQPKLVPSATARIELQGDANCPEAVRGLEQFSHLWILFLFDQNQAAGWKPTVRPPRLGGNERIGVFASRSTFRPNSIGMSAVEFKGVTQEGRQQYIELGNVDIVHGTPVIDIKPYLPYSDAIGQATGGYAAEEPHLAAVFFSPQAEALLASRPDGPHLRSVIQEVLAQDPRPAYKKGKTDKKEYAVHLFDLNVRFTAQDSEIIVTSLSPVTSG